MSNLLQRIDRLYELDAEPLMFAAGASALLIECRTQIESLQRENEDLKNREQALGEALRFHGFTFEFADDGSLKCGSENAAIEELARRAITPEMREKWHRVATLNPVAGIVYNEPNEKWPEDGDWILIEIESASSIKYESRVHDNRSWPSFGVRWAYISDLLGKQG